MFVIMAKRSLTADEFWRLPTDERLQRCGELSEHEASVARITSPEYSKGPYIPCNDCIHYRWTPVPDEIEETDDIFAFAEAHPPTCKAHPDGLKGEHVKAVMNNHNCACGNGYRFEKKNEHEF